MNQYSSLWFKTFLETIPVEQTEKEIDFLTRVLSHPRYGKVLDLCCGEGRHSHALAARGYNVTGIDCNESAIEIARTKPGHAQFVVGDMRDVGKLGDTYDAVICLWQSFGDFDTATNEDVISQIAHKLGRGGRFVLDIYHRGFFEAHQGTVTLERPERAVIERKWMHGDRLTVELEYGEDTGVVDHFERQLFTPDEIVTLGARFGLACRVACTEFDETKAASSHNPRMQLVFEKK